MTYKDYFVVEVKANGKILRVRDEAVYLPFGSDYSILLKNLNTRKASVNVSIDGQDVLDNQSLILEANQETILEGFLSGNTVKNKFRFIHKTKQIQDHRGDRADDGLIRIEFAYEKSQPIPWIQNTIKEVHHYYHNPFHYTYYNSGGDEWKQSEAVYTSNVSSPEVNQNSVDNSIKNTSKESNRTMDSLEIADVPLSDEGITVKGSECNQQFRYGYIGELEPTEVIIIQLKGISETGNKINRPMTIKSKLTCPTCGTKCKSSMKYCGNCGTFLE